MVEYNPKYDEIIRTWVKNNPRSYFKKIKAKANRHILDYVNSCTPLLSDDVYLISTKVYWVLNRITEFPKCKVCGAEIKKNIKVNEGYPSHCSAKCLANDPEITEKKELSYQRRYGDGVTNPFQAESVKRKIDKTNLEKYGVKRFTQSERYRKIISDMHDDIEEQKYSTHRANNSFNESKYEKVVYQFLLKRYPNLIHNYTSKEYPFNCDFYDPDSKTYIEYNGTWTHGGHFFDENNEDDVKTVEYWKSKNTKYYDNAVYTWSDLDVRKKRRVEELKLNSIVFWNIGEVCDFVFPKLFGTYGELYIDYDRKKLNREFAYYRDMPVDTFQKRYPNRNEIVRFFQQDTFFRKEKEIWRDDENKRNRLILNRCRYLGKTPEELTNMDILTGFKKSGIYYGYSHFNPLWFKWFIRNNDIKTCYDPCGGWGHRLLGGLGLEKYIYNDLSKTTKTNVDRMIDYFGIENTVTYCEDASEFVPPEEFESMFTCPPYFNLEEYECGRFDSRNDYDEFIDSLFRVFKTRSSCKVFGIVLREDLLGNKYLWNERIAINENSVSYLDSKKNDYNEYLYIFRK